MEKFKSATSTQWSLIHKKFICFRQNVNWQERNERKHVSWIHGKKCHGNFEVAIWPIQRPLQFFGITRNIFGVTAKIDFVAKWSQTT